MSIYIKIQTEFISIDINIKKLVIKVTMFSSICQTFVNNHLYEISREILPIEIDSTILPKGPYIEDIDKERFEIIGRTPYV